MKREEVIRSRQNPLFKRAIKIATSARERQRSGQTLLEGMRLISAYQTLVGSPEALIVDEAAVFENMFSNTRPVRLDSALFKLISDVQHSQGIAALVDIPKPKTPAHNEFIVLLDDIQDPGNFGAIMRAAAAAGADAIYASTNSTDAWAPKVLRSAMGAHFALTVIEDAALEAVIAAFKGQTIATTGSGEESLFELDLRCPTAFIIGNEGRGVSPELQASANHRVSIPLAQGVESLNAAVAAGVCFFEKVRQMGYQGSSHDERHRIGVPQNLR